MNPEVRQYRSTLRDEQSRLTRRRIVDAAAELFVARGFVPSTIDAIAEEAGVSRRTVFTSVGSKADVLKLAFDWTLAGDDEPIPIADRPVIQQLMRAEDAVDILDPWLAMNAAINERIAPLYHVMVVAADADPDVARLIAESDGQRLDGARHVAGRLAEVDGLRPGLEVGEAAAVLDVLIDPLIYRRFAAFHRWPTETYVRHLQTMAKASILR